MSIEYAVRYKLIFLFIVILLPVPIKEQLANLTSNEKRTLSGDKPDSIKTLKAIKPGDTNLLPSQWALGPEGSPRWPRGEIKFYIDRDSYGDGIEGRVTLAFISLGYRGDNFCPRYKQLKTKPTDAAGSWLHFTNPDRVRQCVHDAGLDNNGEIKIVLGYDCLKPREIMHTILHGLGFRDEVTHPQRDLFIRIMWENIQPAFRSMFRIQSVETNDAGLMEYDPLSVMHFHDRAYSLNGQPTTMPMLPGLKIEPSEELSHLDKMKIKIMFGHECNKRLVGNIINSACAKYGDVYNDENKNIDNNGGGCPVYNKNDSNQIIVPGNDVKPEGSENDGEGGNDQVVVPGNDVGPNSASDDQIISGNDVADDDKGGDDQVVVPGNDVDANGASDDQMISGNEVADDDKGGNDQVVVPGNDVGPNGASDDQMIPGNEVDDGDNAKVVIPDNDVNDADNDQMVSNNDVGDDKVVVAGNNVKLGDIVDEELSDIDNWDDGVDRKKTKLNANSVQTLSGKLSKHSGHLIPDEEAIILGYPVNPVNSK